MTDQVHDYEAAYWGPNYKRLQQVRFGGQAAFDVGLGWLWLFIIKGFQWYVLPLEWSLEHAPRMKYFCQAS